MSVSADLDEIRRSAERPKGLWKNDAVWSDAVVIKLFETIDKQRLALSRGWTLWQYEYADAHDLWADNAGDGTADERWTL
jgi:hypothetical protein